MFFRRVTVFDYEKALRFKNGKYVGSMDAGQYTLFSHSDRIVKFDGRERQLPIGGQETMTKDGAMVRISMIVTTNLNDPVKFYQSNPVMLEMGYSSGTESDFYLHHQVQIGIREWVAAKTLEEAMEQKQEMAETVLPTLQKYGLDHGVNVSNLQLLDFAIAGSLRSANADILKAEMEGKAAMQRARNEASTLRSLINSAKLTQENPGLMELRILSSGQKPRVTFIVGKPELKAVDSPREP